MSMTIERLEDPYAVLADAYSLLTAGYQHDVWVANLLDAVAAAGLPVATVLDVACGTGNSTEPLVSRGLRVVASDRSQPMLTGARERLGPDVPLIRAELGDMPALGAFDLVTCLDDALNHLLTNAELDSALAGMLANTRAGGGVLFDLNTLPTLRDAFSSDWFADDGERLVLWRGAGPRDLPAGGRTRAEISVFRRGRDGRFDRRRALLEERHVSVGDVCERLAACGADVLAVHGQRRGGHLEPYAGEHAHHKVVLLARRRQHQRG
jgi:SAM-dependent methyltransferase